jgi:hypothetical protein
MGVDDAGALDELPDAGSADAGAAAGSDSGSAMAADAGGDPEDPADAGDDVSADAAEPCAEPRGIWATVELDGVSRLGPGGTGILSAIDLEKDFSGVKDRRVFDGSTCHLSLYRAVPDNGQYYWYELDVIAGELVGTFRNKSVASDKTVREYTQNRVMVQGDAEHCPVGTTGITSCVVSAGWPTRP